MEAAPFLLSSPVLPRFSPVSSPLDLSCFFARTASCRRTSLCRWPCHPFRHLFSSSPVRVAKSSRHLESRSSSDPTHMGVSTRAVKVGNDLETNRK